jgi:hypothetical protein
MSQVVTGKAKVPTHSTWNLLDIVALGQVFALAIINPPMQRIHSPTINSMLTSEMTTYLKYKILRSLTLPVTKKLIYQTPVYMLK